MFYFIFVCFVVFKGWGAGSQHLPKPQYLFGCVNLLAVDLCLAPYLPDAAGGEEVGG